MSLPQPLAVAYIRDTGDPLTSLGAQRDDLDRLASERGLKIGWTYLEREPSEDRPEFSKAIRCARRFGATLAIARLDDLILDRAFIDRLFGAGVPLLIGDYPSVDGSALSRVTLDTAAAGGLLHRQRVSRRTREGLAQRKAEGKPLGNPANLTDEGRAKGSRIAAQQRSARAREDMADVIAQAQQMRGEGMTLKSIADALNAAGEVSRRGAPFCTGLVSRLLTREKLAQATKVTT